VTALLWDLDEYVLVPNEPYTYRSLRQLAMNLASAEPHVYHIMRRMMYHENLLTCNNTMPDPEVHWHLDMDPNLLGNVSHRQLIDVSRSKYFAAAALIVNDSSDGNDARKATTARPPRRWGKGWARKRRTTQPHTYQPMHPIFALVLSFRWPCWPRAFFKNAASIPFLALGKDVSTNTPATTKVMSSETVVALDVPPVWYLNVAPTIVPETRLRDLKRSMDREFCSGDGLLPPPAFGSPASAMRPLHSREADARAQAQRNDREKEDVLDINSFRTPQ